MKRIITTAVFVAFVSFAFGADQPQMTIQSVVPVDDDLVELEIVITNATDQTIFLEGFQLVTGSEANEVLAIPKSSIDSLLKAQSLRFGDGRTRNIVFPGEAVMLSVKCPDRPVTRLTVYYMETATPLEKVVWQARIRLAGHQPPVRSKTWLVERSMSLSMDRRSVEPAAEPKRGGSTKNETNSDDIQSSAN